MKKANSTTAVIYCRVSSPGQVKKGDGLGSQETRCREFAGYRGYEIIEVFRDEGISGGVVNRPGMQAMLKFIKQYKKSQITILIDDITRLARDLKAHLELRTAINEVGATLESPSLEFGEDSDSLLVENLLATVSQHQRQKNAEQVKNRMRARMQNGYWVFHQPPGYKWDRVHGHGKILVKNEPVAGVIKKALESFACGKFETVSEVQRFLQSSAVFTSATQPRVHMQKVIEILQRQFYTGYINLPEWDLTLVKGKHEPLISFETWQKIQDRLNGNAKAPARKDINDDFPLRGFIVCDSCGHPMTSCWSAGRSGKYPYYLCRTKGCVDYKKSIRAQEVEQEFETLLGSLAPSPDIFGMAQEMLHTMWKENEQSKGDDLGALNEEIKRASNKIEQFLNRIIECDSPVVIQTYEQQVRKLEEQKIILRERIAKCGRAAESFEDTFRTGFTHLANPRILWGNDSLEVKRSVLKMTFKDQLAYKRNEGFRTAALSLPFSLIASLKGDKSGMVELRRKSSNQLLQEIQRWSGIIQSLNTRRSATPPVNENGQLVAA